jgi:hypothetical protein
MNSDPHDSAINPTIGSDLTEAFAMKEVGLKTIKTKVSVQQE